MLSSVHTISLLVLVSLVLHGSHTQSAAGDRADTGRTPLNGSIVLYVDDDAPPGGDGQTWQSAFRHLQDALAVAHASNGGVSEIRIAQGTYKPDQGEGFTPGDRHATFQIPSGLSLRGGSAGMNAPDPDVRDWNVFITTLSGDLLGDDGAAGTFQNYGDNSLRIVSVNNASEIVIEGLMIRGSEWNQPDMSQVGGGVAIRDSNVMVRHCRLTLNRATQGGALGIWAANVEMKSCIFETNRAFWAGAVRVIEDSELIASDCRFVANRNAGINAGGAVSADTSSMSFTDCEFLSNVAFQASVGGAIACSFDQPTNLVRCRFENNVGDTGGAVFGSPYALDCLFINNLSDAGGAVGNMSFHPSGTFIRCYFGNNFGSHSGAVLSLRGVFIQCEFENNFSQNNNAGAVRGSGTFINCKFNRNTIGNCCGAGGGLFSGPVGNNPFQTGPSILVNCVFDANRSHGPGGAIRVAPDHHVSIINSTITENSSFTTAVGGVSVGGTASVDNSILWNNAGGNLAGNAEVSFSCLNESWPGDGNIKFDPLFVAAQFGDYRLQPGSPCIDAGDNVAVPQDAFDLDDDGNNIEPIPFDLAGKRRFRNDPRTPDTGASGAGLPPVDMGAYEFQLLADINQDDRVGVPDLLRVIADWGGCPVAPAACAADIAPYPTGDGRVNVLDIVEVIFSWGQ